MPEILPSKLRPERLWKMDTPHLRVNHTPDILVNSNIVARQGMSYSYHMIHMHIICISYSYHIHIIFISYSYHIHIYIYSYHIHIIFITRWWEVPVTHRYFSHGRARWPCCFERAWNPSPRVTWKIWTGGQCWFCSAFSWLWHKHQRWWPCCKATSYVFSPDEIYQPIWRFVMLTYADKPVFFSWVVRELF